MSPTPDHPSRPLSHQEKGELWQTSVEIWRSGAAVSAFMEKQIANLRDADGDPLPEVAQKFLLDLVFCRSKPRRGRATPKSFIRELYRQRLFFEQVSESAPPGSTPSERAIASLARDFGRTEDAISMIVHPRKSRES